MQEHLSQWFVNLLARLAGVPEARPGEGINVRVVWSWPLPPWLTLIVAVAVVGLVVFCYLRERGTANPAVRWMLTGMRLLMLLCMAFMVSQIKLLPERTGLPYFVVLLDDSASMSIADRYDDEQMNRNLADSLKQVGLDEPTRWNLARSILLGHDHRLLDVLGERYKLKLYLVADTLRPLTGELDKVAADLREQKPTGASSRLGESVRSVLNELRGTPPSAILLLSDGVVTEGPALGEAAQYARRKGVPLFTVALGSQNPPRDVELADLLVDEVAFVDDVLNFECTLTGSRMAGRSVQVRLRETGDAEVLASVDVTIGADGRPQKVRVPYRPTEVGKFEYIVDVEPLNDEVSSENNRLSRVVTIRKEQVRVLLVQAYPNFEYRYLKQMLQRDSTIVLKAVLQEADPEYAEFDQTALRVFPVRREELFEYDVLILGDIDPAFFSSSALQYIEQFVTQKGGGVVLMAGPQYMPWAYRDTPLATLIPADLTDGQPETPATNLGYQIEPTELGNSLSSMQLGNTPQETAEIWRNLPQLYWLSQLHEWKPGARVLAQARFDTESIPALVLQHTGAGKVLFHATDETWRWRWRVGDVFFARYWVQTLRFLARSKLLGQDLQVEMAADRQQYRRGDSVRLRVRFLDERRAPAEDDGVVIMVEQQGHPNRRVTLRRNPTYRGVFEGSVSKPSDGKYHAWVTVPAIEHGTAAADFTVVAPPGEFERPQADLVEMKRVATDTKGHFYTASTANRLIDDLPQGHQTPQETLTMHELWNSPYLLGVLFLLLIGEWIIRKLVGML
ncbi:MAG: hypothetical protein JSS27_18730 [Planctomycetes bacterium]|nr:hypothetical protein [Planctomycetota bacterium]